MPSAQSRLPLAVLASILVADVPAIQAQSGEAPEPSWAEDPPSLMPLVTFARGESDFRLAVTRFLEDQAAIGRRGIRPDDPGPIIGDPVMAEGLEAHLAVEMIPYNAEELIAIGWRESNGSRRVSARSRRRWASAMTGRLQSST